MMFYKQGSKIRSFLINNSTLSIKSFSTISKYIPLPNSELATNSVHAYTDLKCSDILTIINKDIKGISGIYAFQFNETNEIVYIGSSIDLARRFWQHQSDNGSNVILQRAFKKYGIHAFNFLVLEVYDFDLNKSDQENMRILTQIEQSYMDLFDSRYNILKIARSSKGYKHTDEAKAKMSAVHSGKTISEETKALISARLKGKVVSKETRAKLSAYYKGKPRSEELKAKLSVAKSIPIYLYDCTSGNPVLIEKFSSTTNVSLFLKANKGTIASYAKSGAIFRKTYILSHTPLN